MSLIDEALKQAEQDRRRLGDPPDATGIPQLGADANAWALADAGGLPVRTRPAVRATVLLAAAVIVTVAGVVYFSLPDVPELPAQARATPEPVADPQTAAEVPAEPDSPSRIVIMPPAPVREPSPAETSVDRTLAALRDYQGMSALPVRPPAGRPEVSSPSEEPIASRGTGPVASGPSTPAFRRGPLTGESSVETTTQVTPEAPIKRLVASRFRLGGILQSGDQAHALINDKLVSVGAKIEGATVVEIHSYHVVLEQDGERLTLRM